VCAVTRFKDLSRLGGESWWPWVSYLAALLIYIVTMGLSTTNTHTPKPLWLTIGEARR
jgi:hypothetical protein